MKQSQWILAAFVLAGLIFIVTFAMNYLGGSRQKSVDPTIQSAREIVFPEKGPQTFGVLEREEKTRGHVDYWFYNPNEQTVQVGLHRKSCRCGSVEVYVLPKDRRPWITRAAAAICGVRPLGVFHEIALCQAALHRIQNGIDGQELLEKTEKTAVPAGQLGWVRIGWSDRAGKQSLEASLWFDDPANGKIGTLNLALYFHEPLRVRGTLRFRTLRDEDLEKGVRESILVWSSTRDSLNLEARPSLARDSALSDPFVVGKPVALSHSEARELARANNEATAVSADEIRGSVRCAYRIPILLQPVAADGKTPFDVGPFHRRVNISSPDVDREPKSVLVTGRVRGLIEIGNEEEGGGINFHDFLRSRGKLESINLESRERTVELSLDRQRTSSFLDAEIEPISPTPAGLLQAWTLRARILPLKADGEFPRPKDPLYEDSAIYLKVASPGKPLRSVRIPVTGRATAR